MDTSPGRFALTRYDLLIVARADGLHVMDHLSQPGHTKQYFSAVAGAHDLAATADGAYYTNAVGDPHRITIPSR